MSHELTQREDGKTEMAYVIGTGRWHGLGNELAEGASIDEWTVAAGMEWKVQRSKVRYVTNGGEQADLQTWADNHVLFRSDNKKPLGIVSDAFKIVQPKTVMEFFRDLCATNGFKMRTAGTLFEGRRFWALADIGEQSYVLDPADKVKGRLLLVTACDGTMKTTAKFVNECVVCNNTLTVARAENGKQIATSHRSVFNPDETKMKLGLAAGQFAAFIEQARTLARVPVTNKVADMLTLKLLAGVEEYEAAVRSSQPAEILKLDEVRESRGYKQIMGLFGGKAVGANLVGRSNTGWAWLNAVTEYADHHVSARSNDNRFNSSQFGAGDKMKNDALELSLPDPRGGCRSHRAAPLTSRSLRMERKQAVPESVRQDADRFRKMRSGEFALLDSAEKRRLSEADAIIEAAETAEAKRRANAYPKLVAALREASARLRGAAYDARQGVSRRSGNPIDVYSERAVEWENQADEADALLNELDEVQS